MNDWLFSNYFSIVDKITFRSDMPMLVVVQLFLKGSNSNWYSNGKQAATITL